jgi:hypothetical protein
MPLVPVRWVHRRRVIERPDAFRKLARLDDKALDSLMDCFEQKQPASPGTKR